MNKQCDIVQDLLPLYAEKMLSDGSKSFVEEHLAMCDECRQKADSYNKNTNKYFISNEEIKRNIDESIPLKKAKRRFRRHLIVMFSIVCMVTLFIGVIFGSFERRIIRENQDMNSYPLHEFELDYFTKDEKDILNHKPSEYEIQIARIILSDAETAFKDNGKYSDQEKEDVYGPLGRYAFGREETVDFGITDKKYSLEMKGCKIDDTSGYIWVNYSSQGYNNYNECVLGNGDSNALWEIAKDENQHWKVVSVKEHP